MQIKFDAHELEKLIRGVEKLQKQIPSAIARGLNEGGDKTRTQVQKALQKQTGLVRYASVTGRVRTVRAFAGTGGASSYEIRVNGRATKMHEFKTVVAKAPAAA